MTATRDEINRQALDTAYLSDNLKSRTIFGSLTNFAAQLTSILLQVGATAILARLLTPADYGLIAMGATATALSATFANLGLSTPTIQRSVISHEQVSTLFFINILAGLVIFLLSCASSPLFAYIFQNQRMIFIIPLLSLAIPFGAVGAQFSAILTRNMQWVTIQAINLGSQVAGILVAIFCAWKLNWGFYALICQQVVPSAIQLLATIASCKWRPSIYFRIAEVRSELKMGLEIALFGLLNYLHRQFDNVMLGARWGASELGLYSRGYNIMFLATSGLTGPITNAIISSLSRVKDDTERWKRIFIVSAAVTATFSSYAIALLYVNAPQLVEILLGSRWGGVVPILEWLLIAGLATAVNAPFGWIFVTMERTRSQLYWILFAAPILVLSFWIGSFYGAVALAKAYAVTIACINFIYVAISVRGAMISYIRGIMIVVPAYLAFLGAVLLVRLLPAVYVSDLTAEAIFFKTLVGSIGFAIVVVLVSMLEPSYIEARKMIQSLAMQYLVRSSAGRAPWWNNGSKS